MSRDTRILVVHNKYQQQGGEWACVNAQESLLRRHNHRVLTYWQDNSDIRNYGLGQKLRLPLNTLYSRQVYQQVRELVAARQPDVAHVHNVFPLMSPSVYRALNDGGVPIVQTIHNFRFMCPNALFYTQGRVCEKCMHGNTLYAVIRRCYRGSYLQSALYALSIGYHRRAGTFETIDRYVALTEFTAEILAKSGLAGNERIRVLGNFLPDPLPNPGSIISREPYVLYLGRLAPEKGVNVLIEAMTETKSLKLKVVGDGPEARALRLLAHRYDLKNVEFLGRLEGQAKWQLLREAQALVLPSVSYENFPVTILESFAAATPVIASDIGSIPYLVDHRYTGLLFRVGDSTALRETLAKFEECPKDALAMGQHGRNMIEARFTSETHYTQLIRIYEEIIA